MGAGGRVMDERGGAVARVRAALSPDLLPPAWRRANPPFPAGYCYVASEALYHLLGGREAGWTPMRARVGEGTHWYLRHQDGTILDPTADQFPPYEQAPIYLRGRGCGFLTRNPSRRTRVLLERVGLYREDEKGR